MGREAILREAARGQRRLKALSCDVVSGQGFGVRGSRRSTEFDAILLAGAPVPAADAYGARDAKVDDGAAQSAAVDPRLLLMLTEAYRHGKALGAWAGEVDALGAAGLPADAVGVVTGEAADTVLQSVTGLLGQHRAWNRFIPAL
ncbi:MULTISPECIES: hypothetical protein [unclassified Streptomyces]|uniref:hypothetical protein n=1 Tax=unclassified Streptomyces TaxID=2593676 RepID=UPI0029A1D2F0|nr:MULTISPECIES: hypothetical protein [unclassified Streptomyces]MDX3771895.1 hypothetical protein [Streptomyces sp. AK08-01B]MDX3821425.1 hypothetical protein [Streptomyces sp. AK08-01A]